MIAVPSDLDPQQRSLGELDAYPLRRSSIICKATGGGRWQPKNSPPRIGVRIPGCKAPYELEMEREDAEERRRRMNPIVRDGGGSHTAFLLHHVNSTLRSLSVSISAGPESTGEYLSNAMPAVYFLISCVLS